VPEQETLIGVFILIGYYQHRITAMDMAMTTVDGITATTIVTM
jgi:hypothetical protein